jgi:tetratricopeptide (TPR) repeat protein
LFLYAGTTFARSLEWSDPARLASSEASKNPRSARAAYDWARTLVILTNYDPRSPFTGRALAAVEKASLLPGSGILPEQAGLMLASRAGLEPNPQWWARMHGKLRARPIGPQERGAIASMTRCQVDGLCQFPPEAMMELFATALQRPDPEIMNIYGDYALNVLHDPDLALKLWLDAIELDPGQPQYRVNAARLLVVLGRNEEAKRQLAALRALGRMGQNEARAAAIEREMTSHGRAK